MALPKIAIPTFSINLPSNKKEVIFRPFMVREEKALLIAMESKDTDHMQRAMIDIIASCIVTEGIDINKLPSFDIEYLFLKSIILIADSKLNLGVWKHRGTEYNLLLWFK